MGSRSTDAIRAYSLHPLSGADLIGGLRSAVCGLAFILLPMPRYEATTDEVTISVRPVYLDGQSDALAKRFTFAYFVRVENTGEAPVKLLSRRWLIRDGGGRVQEVEGEGVVGQQPRIAPGDAHDYHSFCVLEGMEGSMEGAYLMARPDGSQFLARIPCFHLRARAN